MDNYNYPEGSDTKDAPWNRDDEEEFETQADYNRARDEAKYDL